MKEITAFRIKIIDTQTGDVVLERWPANVEMLHGAASLIGLDLRLEITMEKGSYQP